MALKALVFDVFGTLLDWRGSIAREAEVILRRLGIDVDGLAFADAWRGEYQGAMWSANDVANLPPDARRALLVAWQRRDHGMGMADAIKSMAAYVSIDELRADLDVLAVTGASAALHSLLRKFKS